MTQGSKPNERNTINVDPFTRAATVIRPFCHGRALSHASGFFWRHDGTIYLVSNWHVFAGRDAITGQPLTAHGGCPDSIETSVHVPRQDGLTEKAGTRLDLVRDEIPVWLQHPHHGQAVDVAALPISPPPEMQGLIALNDIPETEDMHIGVGQEVHILGYPLDPRITGDLAIWKRGTIASEPSYRVASMPQLLVDSAARPGMSGAPVIARTSGNYLKTNGDWNFWAEEANRFIGVYSGRLGSDMPTGVQLGIVWRREVIDEICGGATFGDASLA